MIKLIQGFNPRIIAISLLSIIYLLTSTPRAQALYDPLSAPNNKVGVHILDPSEIGDVPALVNSNGGDWGYVTVPIQPSDRDQTKWQSFMHAARDKHLIPIVRITTIPFGGTWDIARDTDLVDFANFLAELDWPVENRYIILFNEVNRDSEWGGTVDPAAYTRIVKNAYSIFKERSRDFFMLGPALDSALPNSVTSQSAASYLQGMARQDPAIWSYFDGWASHSYPNPAFSASPAKTGWQSIVSYRTEIGALKIEPKPVFITETGWDQTALTETKITANWRQAWGIWNQDSRVVAVTPFVLQGGDQFRRFSLKSSEGLTVSGRSLTDLSKSAGSPKVSTLTDSKYEPKSETSYTNVSGGSGFNRSSILIKIESFFRQLVGLAPKSYLTVGEVSLTVEIADEAKAWQQGLSGRDSLEPGTGMLFTFPRAHIPIFWMKDMRFPIDIIWINDGQIISVVAEAPVPSGGSLPTYSPPSPVTEVLEVPAGTAANLGWVPGTKVDRYD